MMRPNLLALLTWMNFVELEAEQRDTPDTPVESENDLPLGSLDGSQHPDANTPDDSGTTNPAPTHEQQTPPTPTATAPPTATRSKVRFTKWAM
jgi:hypothetical protein